MHTSVRNQQTALQTVFGCTNMSIPSTGTSSPWNLFHSIVVVELPALKPLSFYPAPPPRKKGEFGPYIPDAARPRSTLVLNVHGDESHLPHDFLSFCFPDLDHLLRSPFNYEHVADEFVFTLTQQTEPFRLHGFCRRYRIDSPGVGNRLDLSPYTSSNESDSVTSFQCICILSEQ